MSTSPATGVASPVIDSHHDGPKRASLLGLPGELRDEIWMTALKIDHKIAIRRSLNKGYGRVPGDKAPLLIHTSRQIRSEAGQIFWRKNIFAVDHKEAEEGLRTFLSGITTHRLRISAQFFTFATLRRQTGYLRGLEKIVESLSSTMKVELAVTCVHIGSRECLDMTIDELEAAREHNCELLGSESEATVRGRQRC